MRQELPLEEITTVEKYQQYLLDEFGITGGSLDVAERLYMERYEGLEQYGIRPVRRVYLYQREPFVETRYAIRGAPGLWGRFRAYGFAAERSFAAGDFDVSDMMVARLEEMEEYPERRRARWREPEE